MNGVSNFGIDCSRSPLLLSVVVRIPQRYMMSCVSVP